MKSKLIIDTNLTILLIIGSLRDGEYIVKSKLLSGYQRDDHEMLVDYMALHDLYTTSHIVTEVTDLIGNDLYGELLLEAMVFYKDFLVNKIKEIPTKIINDIKDENFAKYFSLPHTYESFYKFGLTDAFLIKCINQYQIITTDNELISYLYCINQKNTIPFFPKKH